MYSSLPPSPRFECRELSSSSAFISLQWPGAKLDEVKRWLDARRSAITSLSIKLFDFGASDRRGPDVAELHAFFADLLTLPFLSHFAFFESALTVSDLGEAFFIALKHCQTLRVLDLGDNALGDEGIFRLSSSLPSCLERLILRKNDITDYGVVTFMGGHPPFVPYLDLSQNRRIGESGWDCLMASRYYAYPWRVLDLRDTCVPQAELFVAYFNVRLKDPVLLNYLSEKYDALITILLNDSKPECVENWRNVNWRIYASLSVPLETLESLGPGMLHPIQAYLEALEAKAAICRGTVFQDYLMGKMIASLNTVPPIHPLFPAACRLLAWVYDRKEKTIEHAFYASFYGECADAQAVLKSDSSSLRASREFLLLNIFGRSSGEDFPRLSKGLQDVVFQYFRWHELGVKDGLARLEAIAQSRSQIERAIAQASQSGLIGRLSNTFFTKRTRLDADPGLEVKTHPRRLFQTQAR